MAIYCWGKTAHGELGFGGIEDEQILMPKKMTYSFETSLKQVACGRWHSLFLTTDGKIFACGNNDNGQLGHNDQPTKRPRMSLFNLVKELVNNVITQISCGGQHSLALTEWGQLFCWGHNDQGQLGLANAPDVVNVPKILKFFVAKSIIQVATGQNHTLALTNCGELYSWGSNSHGQLGVRDLAHSQNPCHIFSMQGIPIAFIACGGNHSFVISKSGAVFGWGRNNAGQLGLNDEVDRYYPTQLKTMRSLGVRYITCGNEFSVFLTNDGGVFTCGSGAYGQLGHGSFANEVLPRMVMELMGSTITQVACGERHTLAFVPSRGRVYGFGLGSSGQLGTRIPSNSAVPQVVIGPWVSPSGSTLIQSNFSENTAASVTIKKIFSGGDHSFVTTTNFIDRVPAADCRFYEPQTQIHSLTLEYAKECSEVRNESVMDLDLLTVVELIFKSSACMNGSFLLDDFKHLCCTSKHHGVNLKDAQKAFEYIQNIKNDSLKNIIWDQVTKELLESLIQSPPDVEALRIYLLLPLYHEFVNSKNYQALHTPFSYAVLRLDDVPKKIVSKWWAETTPEFFERLVCNYKNVVAHIISFNMPPSNTGPHNSEKRCICYNSHLNSALSFLVLLHRLNHKERKEKLHYEIFHWPELVDFVDIQQDYIQWLFDKNQAAFNICNYPFLFNAAAKTTLLQTDQAIQMHNAMQNAANSVENYTHSVGNYVFSILTNEMRSVSQFIVLNVSRENLVEDTLREIMQYNQSDLKKPLKIKFHGEEAEDAGGVRKEFFMLLLKDLIDPKYGMFKQFEDSRVSWFADLTFETEDMYFLIGVICGLAIYNFTIINLPFPLALYKKLLDEPVDLSDLYDLSPTIANSMQSILNFNGDDFVQVFNLYFEISRDIFGASKAEPLKPNGDKIPVTLDNRKEFVDLYVDFIFNKAVANQFKAFRKGFMKVCWGRVLQIFKPQELMAMVVGNEEYDWQTLELGCGYKNGYTSSDQTVRWFWEIFHELPESEKKKFLLYLTGSDRIPIQGMKAIKIYIQPTSDERFLPVAHTCFNLLDLPRYQTKERLKFKLQQAIQQTQVFSIV